MKSFSCYLKYFGFRRNLNFIASSLKIVLQGLTCNVKRFDLEKGENMPFVAFDVETTGFLAGVDQITEIAAVRFENGQPIDAFVTLVNPGKDIPSKVTDLTGITNEMVKDEPTIDQILDKFATFCGTELLVAHNAPFDFEFLTVDIKKFQSKAPQGLIFDSCSMSRRIFPGLLNYKLGTLVKHLKISSSGFHRAKEDASYCGYLMVHIHQKMLKGRIPFSVEKLTQINGSPPLKFVQIKRQPKQVEMFA